MSQIPPTNQFLLSDQETFYTGRKKSDLQITFDFLLIAAECLMSGVSLINSCHIYSCTKTIQTFTKGKAVVTRVFL